MYKKLSFLLAGLALFFIASCSSDSSTSDDSLSSSSVFTVKAVGTRDSTNKPYEFTWMDGETTRSFKSVTGGKVVLLNFWATWCGPCVGELPDIDSIYRAYKDKGVLVIGMNVDGDLSEDSLKSYFKKNDLTYPDFIGGILANAYGISAIPQTYIINKKGEIYQSLLGSQSYSTFETYIDQCLK